MSWTVRPVEPADEPRWRELYRGYRAFYRVPESEAAVDTVWRWLHDPAHETHGYVAVDDTGRVGGLAHVRRFARPLTATTGLYLDDLFTGPALREQGVGRVLLDHLASYAGTECLSVVRWVTATDNATARRLYDDVATASPWVTYDLAPR